MKKLALILMLLVGGWIFSSSTGARTLEYTLPAHNAAKGVDPETGDSISLCEPNLSAPLNDLQYTRIFHYRYISGGVWQGTWRDKYVVGREGQVDTLIVPDNVYIQIAIRDFSGNQSCMSEKIAPIVTGVPTDPMLRLVKTEIYDLRGRRIDSLIGKSSGIYFRKYYWSDGVTYTKKFVHLR